MASFSSELAVKFPIQLEANHVVDKKQVWIAAVSHGPTGHCLNATYKNTESFAFQGLFFCAQEILYKKKGKHFAFCRKARSNFSFYDSNACNKSGETKEVAVNLWLLQFYLHD